MSIWRNSTLNLRLHAISGNLTRLLHPTNLSSSRVVRYEMEDGSSLMAVLLKSRDFKHFIFLFKSGNSSRLEQSDRFSVSRCFNLQMLIGRFLRCLLFSRSSFSSNTRFLIDEGISCIIVPPKYSSFTFGEISGKFSSLEQPERFKTSKDSKSTVDGTLSRFEQPFQIKKFKILRT